MSTNYNPNSQYPDPDKIAKDLVLLGVDALTVEDVAARHALEVCDLIAFIQTKEVSRAVVLAEAESNLSGKTSEIKAKKLIKRLLDSFDVPDLEGLPLAARLRALESVCKAVSTLKGISPERAQVGTGFSVTIIMGDETPAKEIKVIDMGDAEEVRP